MGRVYRKEFCRGVERKIGYREFIEVLLGCLGLYKEYFRFR